VSAFTLELGDVNTWRRNSNACNRPTHNNTEECNGQTQRKRTYTFLYTRKQVTLWDERERENGKWTRQPTRREQVRSSKWDEREKKKEREVRNGVAAGHHTHQTVADTRKVLKYSNEFVYYVLLGLFMFILIFFFIFFWWDNKVIRTACDKRFGLLFDWGESIRSYGTHTIKYNFFFFCLVVGCEIISD